MAQQHWARWLPTRYATIRRPAEFFSTLGQQAETQIQELSQQLAGPDRPGEDYLQKVGRLNMARASAEEHVLAELVLPAPEDDAQEDLAPEEDPTSLVSDVQQAMDQARRQDPHA